MISTAPVRRLLIAALLFAPAPLAAQAPPSRGGPRQVLGRSAEITLARSGAPPEVSAGSRVWVFDGKRYAVGDSGTTAVSCYVGRPWGGSLEPHCFDPEASATILPIQMRRIELYAAGRSETEVEADIAAGLTAGRFRLPARPAVTYMMSSSQNLITDQGNRIGSWRPHLMIYQPYITAEAVGLIAGVAPGTMLVENSGKAFAALIVPLSEFVPGPTAP